MSEIVSAVKKYEEKLPFGKPWDSGKIINVKTDLKYVWRGRG